MNRKVLGISLAVNILVLIWMILYNGWAFVWGLVPISDPTLFGKVIIAYIYIALLLSVILHIKTLTKSDSRSLQTKVYSSIIIGIMAFPYSIVLLVFAINQIEKDDSKSKTKIIYVSIALAIIFSGILAAKEYLYDSELAIVTNHRTYFYSFEILENSSVHISDIYIYTEVSFVNEIQRNSVNDVNIVLDYDDVIYDYILLDLYINEQVVCMDLKSYDFDIDKGCSYSYQYPSTSYIEDEDTYSYEIHVNFYDNNEYVSTDIILGDNIISHGKNND